MGRFQTIPRADAEALPRRLPLNYRASMEIGAPVRYTGKSVHLWADVPAAERATEDDIRSMLGARNPAWLATHLACLHDAPCRAAVRFGGAGWLRCGNPPMPGREFCSLHLAGGESR